MGVSGRDRDDARTGVGVGAPPWVVSPHLLVSQAVGAALGAEGTPVAVHPWETFVHEAEVAISQGAAVHVVVILDALDSRGVREKITRLLALGEARIAVVTAGPPAPWWGGLLEGEAVEVVSMATSVMQLARVVQRFASGERLMDLEKRAEMREAWAKALDRRQHLVQTVRTLTPQQLRVLELLSSGRRVREVAEVLGVTSGTVRSHVKTLRAKLGARTQLEAVAMLRQVHEVGDGADLVPRPRAAAPADEESVARR
ncbi:LuxR C-terminal-related transcriptional regulator [Microbacterium sp. ARD31]|uniref:response regulator transcription factor n=1 Tax=Microbacterium sp. ARD31 TaxID=2962576 RepID=UPI0028827F62|nr:LuxR C-terminal-related transcriptional regulator [Microbacterium sp. ARD31]MDT0186569.1 LuxR C-terminal-related transcriptional regulator [Microbacterium sp. ARD31]